MKNYPACKKLDILFQIINEDLQDLLVSKNLNRDSLPIREENGEIKVLSTVTQPTYR